MNITSIFREKKVFTLQELNELLPLVLRLTAEAQREVTSRVNRMEAIKYGSQAAADEIESEIKDIIDQWQRKVTRLGGKPKGLWLADFDHGTGYFCWKYPESRIRYSHGYQDGFSGRVEIQQPEGSL